MSSFSEAVFERTGRDHISERTFMFILGGYLSAGIAASTVLATLTYQSHLPLLVVIGLCLLPFVGIWISMSSDNWMVSTLGYALVVAPFGALLGPFAAHYKLAIIVQAMFVTLFVTIGMWVTGTAIPRITKDYSGWIVGILLFIIGITLLKPLMAPFGLSPVATIWWHWLCAAFFAALIVYDVNKAMQMPKTLDNAVDAAVGLYLDVLNFFLHAVKALGSSSSDD
jgi:FtsH-binding integral membrane protein